MSWKMAQKVIVPKKKNYVPQFLKQRDINSYYVLYSIALELLLPVLFFDPPLFFLLLLFFFFFILFVFSFSLQVIVIILHSSCVFSCFLLLFIFVFFECDWICCHSCFILALSSCFLVLSCSSSVCLFFLCLSLVLFLS